MRSRMTEGLAVAGILLAGCATRQPQASRVAAAPTAAVEPQGPVIVSLVGQHQTIIITSGPEGPLYSAKTADGQPIVANASLKKLREEYPDVYRFVEPTMAVHADVRSAVPDSSRRSVTGPQSSGGATTDRLMLDSSR
jgi:hypothetical protein